MARYKSFCVLHFYGERVDACMYCFAFLFHEMVHMSDGHQCLAANDITACASADTEQVSVLVHTDDFVYICAFPLTAVVRT